MSCSAGNNRKRNRSSQSNCSCRTSLYFILLGSVTLCLIVLGTFLYSNHEHIITAGSSVNYLGKYLASSKQSINSVISVPTPVVVSANKEKPAFVINAQASLPTKKNSRRKRYAFAITITKDGFFQDGAAVLAYSIMKYSKNAPYDISFIAFVHPNVTTSRPGLQRLGYHVIEVPIPINVSAIQFDFLREKINKNGCCGSSELIKLTSYRLMQYDRVIHVDADVIFLNPIDELLERNYSLIYTTDPNMATFKKGIDKMPVQGGFVIIQPSIQDYRAIIHTLMTTEFRKYHGWNASNIGWYWGGMTVQGILPYYYHRITQPNRSQIVDRCYYNTMADTPECSKQTLPELKSAHFTVCQKPWGCFQDIGSPLCRALHQRWFELRAEAEIFYGITEDTPQQKVTRACTGGGHKNYHPMQLAHAHFPTDEQRQELFHNVIPDDSRSRMDPLPESLYVTTQYD